MQSLGCAWSISALEPWAHARTWGHPCPHLIAHISPLLQGAKGERGLPGTAGGKGEKGDRVSVPSHAPCGGTWHMGVLLPWGGPLPPIAPHPQPWLVQAEALSCLPSPAGC